MDWVIYLYKINESLKYPLFKIQNYEFSLWSLVVSILIIWVSRIIANKASKVIERNYFHSSNFDPGRQDSLKKILRYTIYSVGLMIALQTVGIDISALLAGGAILAVGIGFGIQNIVTNFVAGLLILFERPIKRGDFIEIGKDVFGIVSDIAIRNTTVKTLDNVAVLIPNSKFITENITNWTYKQAHIKIRVNYSVPLTADLKEVESILLTAAQNHNDILKDPPPNVLLEVGASLNFYLLIWISNPSLYNVVRSGLNFEIVQEFQNKGIYK